MDSTRDEPERRPDESAHAGSGALFSDFHHTDLRHWYDAEPVPRLGNPAADGSCRGLARELRNDQVDDLPLEREP